MDNIDKYNIVRSKVYNALSDVAYDLFENKEVSKEDQQKYLEDAFEWFMIHYFDK